MTMAKKLAVLLSCSDHYGHRLFATDAALKELGYDTVYVTSDFDHNTKKPYACTVEDCVQLHAVPYQKNLSAARIHSHWRFARDAFRYLERLPRQPDVVLAVVPPNFLAFYGARYRRKHPQIRLVFDIFDLWPETFPSGKGKKLLSPVFGVWAWLRDRNLPAADLITTECDLFREKLQLSENGSKTVYLCADPMVEETAARLPADRLSLCYLGAINNVIDIPAVCGLLRQLSQEKHVTLHIVGKGERQQELITGAKEAGAEVVFHGPVFDPAEKAQILCRCHFGLNIMKETVCIGLSMKSVDYFRFGLPIINSIPADTRKLVNAYGAGLEYGPDCAKTVLALTEADCLQMRENAKKLFRERFDRAVIHQQYIEVFNTYL